jgi:hypothetical protein
MALKRLDIATRTFQDGRSFGHVGAYEELYGEAEFAVDPYHPLNKVITDLDLAPRDGEGRVHFTANVRILQPADRECGNGGLFLDVVNRGRSVFCRMLEPGPMGPSTDITEGILLRRGFTVVTCGWQHDVPQSDSSFGLSAPVATSVGAPVTGCGFLALRDLVSHLRRTAGLQFALALGGSQSGRLLRHMVYLGACEDEHDQLVLDGVLAVAAGARMTEANLRSGEPSSNGPKSAMFPYTDAEFLLRAEARGKVPRLIHLNTSSEYCSSAAIEHVSAALCHISADRSADLEMPENVRMYLCASTQHAPWPLEAAPDGRGVNAPNTIDYKPFVRAAVDGLAAWITRGTPPPPSVYPRFSEGSLTPDLWPAGDADGNELGGLRHPDVAVPLATYTGWNPAVEDPRTLVRALGSTIPFSPEAIARRYGSRAEFLGRVREAGAALARDGYLLADDVEPIVSLSASRWDRQVVRAS